jgi:hypothetical protein
MISSELNVKGSLINFLHSFFLPSLTLTKIKKQASPVTPAEGLMDVLMGKLTCSGEVFCWLPIIGQNLLGTVTGRATLG